MSEKITNYKMDYQNRLSHLSLKDREDLMWFYYGGVEEDILIKDYAIDIDNPLLLYRTFPLQKDYQNRDCPHCKIPLLAFSEDRKSYQQEVFCEQCCHLLDELYCCQCDICSAKRNAIIESIQIAFSGVVLGSGVGLFEGQALDDYASETECREMRKKDELFDWQNIPAQKLDECYSSLSFFDAEGMRFHLPAFIISEINNPGESNANVIFHLLAPVYNKELRLQKHSKEQFSLFNQKQRQAVRLFLQYCLDVLDYEYDVPLIKKALDEYWLGACPKI